jgi:predicted DNA-binding ribbon-helix-helix protein
VVTAIDSERASGNLSSAIRLFVLDYYRAQIATGAGTRNGQTTAKDTSALHETR